MAWNISNILVNESIAVKKAGGGGGSDLSERVTAWETTVGDETSGLVKAVDDLEASEVSNLDDLTDVEITEPTSGQILKYDGTKWINGTGGSGGSGIEIAETETKIGTFGSADLYCKSFPITSITNTGTLELAGIPAGSTIIGTWGGITESGTFKPLPYYTNVSSPGPIGFDIAYSTDKWLATWRCPSAHSTITGNLVVMYTKPAPAENTRKGGKK